MNTTTPALSWITTVGRAASVLLLAVVAGLPAQADYLAYAVGPKSKLPLPQSIDPIDAKYLVNLEWGEYQGGKSRVAVMEVENHSPAETYHLVAAGGQAVAWGTDDVRTVPVNGIEAIITDVMNRTGRFRLVERQVLDSVFQEQDLAASGRVAQPSGAQIGNVLGAEYLVQVVVTDYEANVSGKRGGGLGGLVGDSGGLLGAIGMKSGQGRVGMNFRLIDAETSEVLYTKQIESLIQEVGLTFAGVGVGGGGLLGGFMSSYSRTPIGQAVIAGINKGVYELIKEIGTPPASGSVVKAEGNRIWVNIGSTVASVGDVLEVLNRSEELIDPETGISLGSMETSIGTARVVHVQDRFSVAESITIAGDVKRGDKVVSTVAPPGLEYAASWEKPKRGKF